MGSDNTKIGEWEISAWWDKTWEGIQSDLGFSCIVLNNGHTDALINIVDFLDIVKWFYKLLNTDEQRKAFSELTGLSKK